MKHFKQLLPEYRDAKKSSDDSMTQLSKGKLKQLLSAIFGQSVETPEKDIKKPTNRYGRTEISDPHHKPSSAVKAKFGRYDVASDVENPSFYNDKQVPPTGSGTY